MLLKLPSLIYVNSMLLKLPNNMKLNLNIFIGEELWQNTPPIRNSISLKRSHLRGKNCQDSKYQINFGARQFFATHFTLILIHFYSTGQWKHDYLPAPKLSFLTEDFQKITFCKKRGWVIPMRSVFWICCIKSKLLWISSVSNSLISWLPQTSLTHFCYHRNKHKGGR